jgi:hypothetical protein
MKSVMFAAAIAAVTALGLSPVLAAQYSAPSQGTWHYEYQYHYTGHHPEYRGGWVLVK